MRMLLIEHSPSHSVALLVPIERSLRRMRRVVRHAIRHERVRLFRVTSRVDPAYWWLAGALVVGGIFLYLLVTDTAYHAGK